ncbi:MAG: ATP-binding protein [Clostridiales bacterium]|jgi:serine/threonine-protein kinase RsbW|nr:ATP-binding protein [Eubacteriales bacterium]MDH7566337.1 ATP-binding protein [Clostridiales bacterium]
MKLFSCTISSDLSNIRGIVQNVLDFLETSFGEIEESNIFEIKVILNELILNAIKHGNHCESCKCVKITAGLTEDACVFFIVEDEGAGYDYTGILENSRAGAQDFGDLCNIKETGRGLLIIKSLCDKIKFNQKGNKVIVLKRLQKI